MAARMKSGATYEDLVRLPENMVGELIEGELYAWPRPGGKHARGASALGMDIGGAYDRGRGGPGGWWILFEPELHLGRGDVAVPDLAGWRRERMPEIPTSHIFEVEPDWVCEVLSPSTRSHDRRKKLPLYARNDVSYVWLFDPEERSLEVMQLIDGRWTVLAMHGGNDVIRAEPFPLVEIDLASIWGHVPDDDSPLA
jgi:Uma2 family endonuclease